MIIFNPDAGKILPGKETWLLWLTGIFLFTFFIPGAPVINNLAILFLVICCLTYNSWKEKYELLKQRPAILFIILFYILQLISAIISDDESRGFSSLRVRIPLLLFPISLGLIYIGKALKIRVYMMFAGIVTLAAIFCLLSAMFIYYRTGDSGFIYNDSLTDAIGKQSVYFALMVNLAIFSFTYLLIKNYIFRAFRKYIIISIAFLMIIHFLLASRMEITFLYSSATIFALYYFFVKKKNKKTGFMMIGGLIVCGFIFVQLFPKTINRFNELLYPEYNFKSQAVEAHYNMQLTPDQWNGFNIRLAIWNCGWEIFKEHPVIGVKLGDKDQALLNKYTEKGFSFGIRTNKNMHSTYLDILASMGITGFLVFAIGFLILPLMYCKSANDVLGTLVIIDFMLSFITETYPDRSMGSVIFGFFISFIISYKGKWLKADS